VDKPHRHGVVEGPENVTDVVLRAMSRTPDPRLREVMQSLVRHLHAFLREAQLTPEEFEAAVDFIEGIGKASGPEKNEVILASDLLGASTLVMMLDSQASGGGATDAALLGPFFRANAPAMPNGADIARDAGGGKPLVVRGRVRDTKGRPLAGAFVEVWQASPIGLYENQDPEQPEHNLRGRFETDTEGAFHFRSVKPSGYPVPPDGPCGALLRAQDRHPYRPAHIHFMIVREGHKTLITQVFDNADDAIESDVVFGVTPALSGDFRRQTDGTYLLEYDFVMQPGPSRVPRAPIP
jgi:catechol 1,2-dioxygenase